MLCSHLTSRLGFVSGQCLATCNRQVYILENIRLVLSGNSVTIVRCVNLRRTKTTVFLHVPTSFMCTDLVFTVGPQYVRKLDPVLRFLAMAGSDAPVVPHNIIYHIQTTNQLDERTRKHNQVA